MTDPWYKGLSTESEETENADRQQHQDYQQFVHHEFEEGSRNGE
jgi:hypothetical protein